MKDLIYYEMRAYLYKREEQQSASFKLSELEKLWYCTQKNVKRRLKQFEAAGKLAYKPGLGRGHSSSLVFHNPFQEEIEKTVIHLVQNKKMESIILLLQLPIPKTWIANVSKEVQALFGLHVLEQSKDVLRTMVTRNLTTLDPLLSSITFETYLIHQLGDSLLAYHQEQDLLQPHLAHSWEQEDEGRIWTFYLRKGVRFHNGHGLTSEDVRSTFQRFKDNDSAHSWLTEGIEKLECPSPYSIVFTLNKPNLLFPRYVSSHNLAILSANELFDERKWIGTGPFQLKKRTDQLLVLQAFDDYFLTRPFLDEIEFYRVDPQMASSAVYELAREKTVKPALQKSDIEVGFRFLAFNLKRIRSYTILLFGKPSIIYWT
ncbi:SgrR family transcriptional regulator [Metabacillus sp. KIGAM252]|uniref:SgrR family transcriptional regulator n=1 Tax=Metabacillus flavus TaxID=2823519 RepID=A0ABS5LBJ0_9BACI|nr:ABC transporter substrate-binding protein [Metabacillus flavus]MBS2968095.1 SgrR family transcriptional regulator [Metabacillus flavus]